MSLTQYLESLEDQDITILLNFTRTQERRREGGFLCRHDENLGLRHDSNYLNSLEYV